LRYGIEDVGKYTKDGRTVALGCGIGFLVSLLIRILKRGENKQLHTYREFDKLKLRNPLL
jgi:Na+/H+ antiporter NhaA